MWHGDPASGRRPTDWALPRARMDHFVAAHRARPSHHGPADACARRFTESLEEAVLDLETGEGDFTQACRKADHVGELRRVLGLLLDVLADWELLLVTHRDPT